ncbi:MarR family winged helix-turn-helix transcriptional regulator [Herbiconiux sp. A18JL235]|uniref:MarR family winged helix-turn-helix transcriptional regulator n=1 Tax=Herbiconiux sp. A18JL235 TaxID=3152363 RepID=A0AB39BDK5_9MICO
MSRSGGDLALLMLAGFRTLAERGTAELARRGYPDFRPVHDFALHSVASGASNASELGRALAVSKQAAARTISVLEDRGYLAREADTDDRRKMRLRVTERGAAVMREGEEVFDALRDDLVAQLGANAMEGLEESLRLIVGGGAIRLDAPGWRAAVEEE